MNELELVSIIKVNELRQDFYFQSLFQAICENNLITQSEIERIQFGLIELLGQEVDRYNNGESTSIQEEKAQALFRSVTYSLGFYLKSNPAIQDQIQLLRTESIKNMFYQGMELVAMRREEAKELLQELHKTGYKFINIAYQDTVYDGLLKFFHDYNVEFAADDIPASIDYPLLVSVEKYIGVEYISEYIKGLLLENELLIKFEKEKIEQLLKSFHKDAEHMLINQFELVLTNALGCILVKAPVTELIIRRDELKWLTKRLKPLNQNELFEMLRSALQELGEKLHISNEIVTYAQTILPDLTSRVISNLENDTLSEVFICFEESIDDMEYYQDGAPLEDEELRELIEELNRMTSIPDRINRIRETVKSYLDMDIILSECFIDNEILILFTFFTQEEKNILYHILQEEAGPVGLEEYEPEQEWKKVLLRMENINGKR
jgi:hypothetical protein